MTPAPVSATASGLKPNTVYYWKITAETASGATTDSAVRSFKTGSNQGRSANGRLRNYRRDRAMQPCAISRCGGAFLKRFDRRLAARLSFTIMEHASLLEKIDAYLFKFLGVALGFAGCAALVINNPFEEFISNIYGILFFIMFAILGVYSSISVIKDILPQGRHE